MEHINEYICGAIRCKQWAEQQEISKEKYELQFIEIAKLCETFLRCRFGYTNKSISVEDS